MELVDGDVPHRGALSKKITWTSVVMLLLGCTLTVVAYVIATLVAMPQWTGVVKEEMLEEDWEGFGNGQLFSAEEDQEEEEEA